MELLAVFNLPPVSEADVLGALARQIETAHKAALRAAGRSLEHARQVGLRLIDAKRRVGRGGWLAWLARNVSFDRYRAAEYMRVAARWDEIAPQMCGGRTQSIRAALRVLAEPWETPEGQAEAGGELDDEGARALVAAAWASLPADSRQEMADETEEQLAEEAQEERGDRADRKRLALLDYAVRTVIRLVKRLTKLGKPIQPVLRSLERVRRRVEAMEGS